MSCRNKNPKYFIDLSAELLLIVAQSSKFELIIEKNAELTESECCNYLKLKRDLYASVAVSYLVKKFMFFCFLFISVYLLCFKTFFLKIY